MNLGDFDFNLPEELIADRPKSPRSFSKLLVSEKLETFRDKKFYNLPELLGCNDLLIFNNTKVIPSRIKGKRIRAGNEAVINVTLVSLNDDEKWNALIKPLRKINVGEYIYFDNNIKAQLSSKSGVFAVLKFNIEKVDVFSFLSKSGLMPLPPYIEKRRVPDERDLEDYQSIFAKYEGAVAAPTASLHFDKDLLNQLTSLGVQKSFVTLHVGAGTFLPVKESDIKNHKMHSEWGCIGESTVEKIRETKSQGGRVIPVGTTALRVLETAALNGRGFKSWEGKTDIFIYPGFEFMVCDGLITNFHLPKSTLIMLVSAFLGEKRTMDLYSHAVKNRYRFFSYGDACLLLR